MSLELLAKSKPKRSLLHHTLDVAKVAQQYAKRWQHLSTLAGDETLLEDLLIAALLHDLGKAASGFQNNLNDKDDESWGRYRHEILSAAIIATWPYSERRQDLLLAVLTHHMGMNADNFEGKKLVKFDPRNDELVPFADRLMQLKPHWDKLQELYKALQFEYTLELPPLPADASQLADPFQALREGVITTRGRSRERTARKLALRKIFLRGLLVASDHLASAAITEHNALAKDIAPDLPSLRSITADSFSFDLNRHQHICAKTTGSVFLNAPTGSGKTEAALLWMQANQTPKNTRHVFYVLPFTASINAMYHRLKDAHFGEDAVSLLHGRSSYFAYQWLCEQEPDIDTRLASKRVLDIRRQTKELYYPVKVLTPHQILTAFMGIKGWEKNLCEYAGGLFILDEIHAYDPHLTGLLFEMLRRLTQDLGAKICVMSATFPTLLKKQLEQHLGNINDIHLSNDELDRYSRHEVDLIEGTVEDYLDDIRIQLQQDLRVLVVLNTVKAAMLCFEALRENAKNPCLVHGRLIQKDRSQAERRLVDKNNPVDLLVGTQAIEVSLDIDFDVLYTDPAPLDALLQRFGRVNRKPLHALERLPSDRRYRKVYVCNQQWPDTPAIYDRSDAGKRLVKRTLEVMPKGEVLLESQVGKLVDAVFDEQQLEPFLKEANQKMGRLQELINQLEPGNEKPFDEEGFLEIESIPIVPKRYRDEHKRCLEDGRFFDALSFEFNITLGRYHALKAKQQIHKEPVDNRTVYYGLFQYTEGIGPDFDIIDQLETELW